MEGADSVEGTLEGVDTSVHPSGTVDHNHTSKVTAPSLKSRRLTEAARTNLLILSSLTLRMTVSLLLPVSA